MDNFSGDTEVSNKGPSSKIVKEAPGRENRNFLSVLNSEHSNLPESFSIGEILNSGLDILRQETLEKKVEIGGVIFEDAKNEPKIQIIEPTASSNSSVVGIGFRSLNESNIESILQYQAKYSGKEFLPTQVYFTDSHLESKYRHFFENLIREDKKVIIDGKPLAVIHSHPSGNLPSLGDFHQVLSFSGEEVMPEAVLTEDWVYFLVPTKQTSNLSKDLSQEESKTMGPEGWDSNDQEEDRAVDHLLSTSQKENSEENRAKALNAVRLKVITDKCLKYNVGFYALAKGESVAKRIA